MTHKVTLRSNPRLLFLGGFIVGLPVSGLLLFLYLGGLIGVLAILGSLFISYQIIRFLISHMRSRIETTEDGIQCRLSGNNDVSLRWEDISHAGFCHEKRQKPCVFLYDETDDKFVIIPREFSDFDHLLNIIKQKTLLQEIELAKNESIKDWLRKQLDIQEGVPDEETSS